MSPPETPQHPPGEDKLQHRQHKPLPTFSTFSLSADNKVSSTFLSAFLLESCFSRCLAQPPVLNARPKTVREVCNNIYMHTYGQSAQSCLCLTTDGKTNNVSSSCPVYFETRLSFFGFRVIYSDWYFFKDRLLLYYLCKFFIFI